MVRSGDWHEDRTKLSVKKKARGECTDRMVWSKGPDNRPYHVSEVLMEAEVEQFNGPEGPVYESGL